MSIRAHDLARLEQHALACAPEEGCGVLVGRRLPTEDRVDAVVPTDNGAPAGQRPSRFLIPPAQLAEVQRAARAAGREVLGYFHSHPRASGEPSATDTAHAIEGVVTAILGLRDGVTDFRCYRAQIPRSAAIPGTPWTPIAVTILPSEEESR